MIPAGNPEADVQNAIQKAIELTRKDERAKQAEVFKKMVDDSSDHFDEVILARSNKCEHKEGKHVHLAVKNFLDDLHLVRWQTKQKEREMFKEILKTGQKKFIDRINKKVDVQTCDLLRAFASVLEDVITKLDSLHSAEAEGISLAGKDINRCPCPPSSPKEQGSRAQAKGQGTMM